MFVQFLLHRKLHQFSLSVSGIIETILMIRFSSLIKICSNYDTLTLFDCEKSPHCLKFFRKLIFHFDSEEI